MSRIFEECERELALAKSNDIASSLSHGEAQVFEKTEAKKEEGSECQTTLDGAIVLATGFNSFNDSIVWEIMKRLPVKLLAQHKATSKEWDKFISDPYFVKLHREFTHSWGLSSILIESPSTDEEGTPSEIFIFALGMQPRLIHEGHYFNSDGPLIHCVAGMEIVDDVILNLSTDKQMRLPPLDLEFDLDTSFVCPFYFFGFDPLEYEYKVLCAIVILSQYPLRHKKIIVYKMLRIGKSGWKDLKKPLPECFATNLGFLLHCCVKGQLYFYA